MNRVGLSRAALLVSLACLVLAGGAAHAQPAPEFKSPRAAAELMDAVMWNREPIGGPFRLIDHRGRTRSERDFRGRLMLVYFGFATCPDICPTDLMQIAEALRSLGPRAGEVAPLFITLDPQRDTRQLLAAYVPAFHPQLVGLTGSLDEVRRAADAYKVFYEKVAIGGALGYTVDHSSFIYLMARDGRYLEFLPPGSSAQRIAAALRPHLAPSPTPAQ